MGADQTQGLQTMQSYPATLFFKGKRKWTAHLLKQALMLLHPDIVQAVSEYLLLLLGSHRNASCLCQPGFTGQLFGNAEKSVMLGQEERNKKRFWKSRKQELDKTTKQEPLWAQSVQTQPVHKAVCIHATGTSWSRKTKSYLRVLLEAPLWKNCRAGTPHGEVFGKLKQLWQRRGMQ